MKSLQESLFDKDLVKRDIGILDVITNDLENFIGSKPRDPGYKWLKVLKQIQKDINYSTPEKWSLKAADVERVEKDELYVYIGNAKLILIAKGLIVDNPIGHSTIPDIVIFNFSPNIDNIYADIYRSKTVDYKLLVGNYKYNVYLKMKPEEIKRFRSEVMDNVEQVF